MARRMVSPSQIAKNVDSLVAPLNNLIGRAAVSIGRGERVEDANNKYIKTAQEVYDIISDQRIFFIKTTSYWGNITYAICIYTEQQPSTLDTTTVFTGKIISGVKLVWNTGTRVYDVVDLTGGTWNIKYLYTGVDSWVYETTAAE